jgi:signal transduction histidine kinase
LGYKQSELIDQHVWKFIHKDDLPFVKDTLDSLKPHSGSTSIIEFRVLDKADSWRYFEATCSNLLENDIVNGIIINYHDISERKDAEVFQQEIHRLDQLKTIGQMAAGIGHEIRNPMTTIRGYLQLLQEEDNLKPFQNKFELMIDEIDRANSIISDFLSLAQTKPSETKLCNLNDIITKIYPLIQADSFTKNMEIIFEPGDIPLVPLNIKEIHQLILNLCRNGLEAMKEGGCLMLRTFKDGQNVVLSVKDEGTGIPVENLDKLGKPFFSTKDNGTGLGLASCFNIATRHNALIDVDTSTDGTTFFIRFNYGKSPQ